jgi:metaxin
MMLTLYVFPGNEFTASIDAGSLQLITYLRLLGDNSPVHVVSTCNHLKVPTRSLPTLVIDGVTYSRVDDILKEFRKQGLSIDELTEVELAEVFAYQSMLADRLKLPLLYLHWLDGKNYTDVTRKWIGQMSSFPLSQYILSSQHRSAKQLFDSSLQHITKLEQKELELINQAEETLNLLNARLQKRSFFFGTK